MRIKLKKFTNHNSKILTIDAYQNIKRHITRERKSPDTIVFDGEGLESVSVALIKMIMKNYLSDFENLPV